LYLTRILGRTGLILLLVTAPAFAISTITITGGNDLLFNNYLFTLNPDAEKVASAITDPTLEVPGAQQVWRFEFDPRTITTGSAADNSAMQFDVVVPLAEVIHFNLMLAAPVQGVAAATIAGGSDCAPSQVSSVCNLIPIPGVNIPQLQSNLAIGAPFLPTRVVNIYVSSLPFIAAFANFDNGMNFVALADPDAPEPGVVVLVACGLGLIALRGWKRH
jgi:hypothetical protein